MQNQYSLVIKRWIDLLGAIILLLLSSGVFLAIGVGYLLQMEFPLFYKQKRIGKDGHEFDLLKFRTLKRDFGGTLEQRRFAWGNFLRRFSFDELPQLWNVLKGEMSLVGPRPLPVEYANLFSVEQNRRHLLRPGLTGLAQVKGRNSISWRKKLRYDTFYVRHLSLQLDMKIFWATIILIFSFRKDVSLLEEKFKGQNE